MMKCIVCGINDAYKFGLCRDCLSSKIRLKTEKVEITECPKCGSVRLNKKWYYNSIDDSIKRNAISHIKAEKIDRIKSVNTFEILDDEILMNLIVDDRNLGEVEKDVRLDLKTTRESCPVCNKFTGSYYEGVIQLRTFTTEYDGILDDAKKEIVDFIKHINRTDPNSFVSKVDKLKEGLDIYLGKKEDAIKIDKIMEHDYFSTVKITKSIAGRKDGKDLFRYTHLIRILDLVKGSVIYDKSYYMVKSITPNNIELLDIKNNNLLNLNSKDFFRKSFDVIHRIPEKDKFIVISADSNETQIMNSKSYKIMTVKQLFDSQEIYLYKYNEHYFSL